MGDLDLYTRIEFLEAERDELSGLLNELYQAVLASPTADETILAIAHRARRKLTPTPESP